MISTYVSWQGSYKFLYLISQSVKILMEIRIFWSLNMFLLFFNESILWNFNFLFLSILLWFFWRLLYGLSILVCLRNKVKFWLILIQILDSFFKEKLSYCEHLLIFLFEFFNLDLLSVGVKLSKSIWIITYQGIKSKIFLNSLVFRMRGKHIIQ